MTRELLAAVSLLALIGCDESDAFAGKDVRKIDVRTTQELFAARDALRKEKPSVPVDVRIAPGEYYFEKPFALTMEEVLTTANPGDRHGETSKLSKEEIKDLAEYVLSL